MLVISNPSYGQLEQRVGLLLNIGRDISRRGEAGFNVDVELKGTHISKAQVASEERYNAFQDLEERGLIEIYDSQTLGDMDGVATFVKVRLTGKGRTLYSTLERGYSSFLSTASGLF